VSRDDWEYEPIFGLLSRTKIYDCQEFDRRAFVSRMVDSSKQEPATRWNVVKWDKALANFKNAMA
jgi:hypothetical protein